jgi:putative phage-type endonuclease
VSANPHQRTDDWFREREGKLTASAFGQAAGIAPGSRQQLWRRLHKLETFEGNDATRYGEENEPVALDAYRTLFRSDISLTGFITHPTHLWLGGSPDLLVSDDGVGEIKCPFSGAIPEQIPPYYMAQAQGLMEITDRQWCDFIYWTPERIRVRRILRSPQYWDWLHVRLADFWIWHEAGVEPPREKKPSPPSTDDLIVADESLPL